MDAMTKARIKNQLIQVTAQNMQGKSLLGRFGPAVGTGPGVAVSVTLAPAMAMHLQGMSIQADAVDKLIKIVEQILDAS